MGILNDFERRLEGAVEGVFSRVFRTGLHPVELATQVLKEMEIHPLRWVTTSNILPRQHIIIFRKQEK